MGGPVDIELEGEALEDPVVVTGEVLFLFTGERRHLFAAERVEFFAKGANLVGPVLSGATRMRRHRPGW
jgi:hypothetical protein